jgi:short subunit dehydrogenase-like uncharacterized protein
LVAGLAVSVGTPVFALLALFPPTRWLLRQAVERCGLAPGQGPSKELQRTGFFKARVVGVAEQQGAKEALPRKVVVEVAGIQDPGYAETAKMLTESALTLVDQAAAKAAGKAVDQAVDQARGGGVEAHAYEGGGVLTPAVALGMPLVRRLRAKGMTFRASLDTEPASTKAKGL